MNPLSPLVWRRECRCALSPRLPLALPSGLSSALPSGLRSALLLWLLFWVVLCGWTQGAQAQTGPVGAGLRATYFPNQELSGSPANRSLAPNLAYDWGHNSPAPGVPATSFSARYEGYLSPPLTGDVDFQTASDSGVRVWMGGQLVIDNWGNSPTQRFGRIHLVQGQKVAFKCEYFTNFTQASLKLLWNWNRAGEQPAIVPASAFTHDAGDFGPPTLVWAQAGSNTVTLNWSAAPQADKYLVRRAPSAQGPWTELTRVDGTTASDSSAQNGTLYFYTVSSLRLRAVPLPSFNSQTHEDLPTAPPSYDESPPSMIVSAQPGGTLAAPSHLAAQVVSNSAGVGQVRLSWEACSGAGSYDIARQSAPGGAWQVLGNTTYLTYGDSSVQNGATYTYVVRARQVPAQGTAVSGDSNPVSAQIQAAPAVPALTATGGNNQVALSWTSSPGASAYLLSRSTQSGGPYALFERATGTTLVDGDLSNGQTFYYVVQAASTPASALPGAADVVSGYSSEVGATPHSFPAAPLQLKATPGDGQILLEWGGSRDAQSYEVWRSTNAGAWAQVSTCTDETTFFIDAGLPNGTLQTYLVRAIGTGGTSQDSNRVSAAPKVLPPLAPDVPRTGTRTADSIQLFLPPLPFNATSMTLQMVVRDSSYGSGYGSGYGGYGGGGYGGYGGYGSGGYGSGGYGSSGSDCFIDLATGLSGGAPVLVPGLTPASALIFRVVAHGSGGQTPGSELTAYTLPLSPGAPEAPTYRNIQASSVVVICPSTPPGASGFRLQRQMSGAGGPVWQNVSSGNGDAIVSPSSPFFEVTGLGVSTTCTFRWVGLGAANAQGDSGQEQAGPSSSVTTSALQAPGAPIAEAVTSTGLRVQRVASGAAVPPLPTGAASLSLQQQIVSLDPYGNPRSSWETIIRGLSGNAAYTFTNQWPSSSLTLRYVSVGSAGAGGGASGVTATAPGTSAIFTTAPGTEPSTPIAPRLSRVGSDSLTVSRQEDGYDNAVSSDWILQQGDGTTFSDIHTLVPGDLSYDVTGLSADTSYSFRFRTATSNGPAQSATTAPAAPAAPTLGAITQNSVALMLPPVPGDVTLTLQRNDPQYGSSGYGNGYGYGAPDAEDESWLPVASGLTSGAGTLVGDLPPGIRIRFRVLAVGPGGQTPGEATSEVKVLDAPPPAPAAPRAVASGPGTILVPLASASPYALETYVQYRAAGETTWNEVTVPSFPYTASLQGLLAATTYQIRLRVVGDGGTATSSFTSVTTPPAAPPVPSIDSITATTLSVTGLASLPGGASSLSLQQIQGYASNAGSVWQTVASGVTPAQGAVAVSGLQPGSAYSFRWLSVGTSGQTPGPDTYIYTDQNGGAGTTLSPPGAPRFSNLSPSSVDVWPAANAWEMTQGGSSATLRLQGKLPGATDYTEMGAAVLDGAGSYGPQRVEGLQAGASYQFRYVVAPLNTTQDTPGVVAGLVIPSAASVTWGAGTGISCAGIRFPSPGMTIHSGQTGRFNAFAASDWDLMQRGFNGLTSLQNVSDTCSYRWTALTGNTQMGSFGQGVPQGNSGATVTWTAPSVTAPTLVTLSLAVRDQTSLNQGAGDAGTRNDTTAGSSAAGAADQPLHFSIQITVLP